MSSKSPVYAVADAYVAKYAELDPVSATMLGIEGYNDRMTDYSQEGVEAQYMLTMSTLTQLSAAENKGERDRIAKELIRERLGVTAELHRAKEHFRGLNILTSPLQMVRMCFDLMPRKTRDEWSDIAQRSSLVPAGIESYRRLLHDGVQQNLTSARRQALSCAAQAEAWAGAGGKPSFFIKLLDSYDATRISDPALRGRLEGGAAAASDAYAEMAKYLRDTYAPASPEQDGIGPERYRLYSLGYNGTELDFEDTYAWGWE
ncbi:MAG: DUF885 domain-containing protein [SAR202 cluster bacterium]|nr:DUF885 domain-containing protein [SAR202 cluster bacterium]